MGKPLMSQWGEGNEEPVWRECKRMEKRKGKIFVIVFLCAATGWLPCSWPEFESS